MNTEMRKQCSADDVDKIESLTGIIEVVDMESFHLIDGCV